MSTMESRKIEEQRNLAESFQRPAEMLDEMKQKWETIMSEQTETMRELVNQTVTSTLEREQAKKMQASAKGAEKASAQEVQLFEQKIEKFENEVKEKEREVEILRREKRQAIDAEQKQTLELEEAKRD